jgi:hypothetical protein
MKKIEDNNTLVFIVDLKANKRQIKVGRSSDPALRKLGPPNFLAHGE